MTRAMTQDQEKSLRFRLSLLCMAAVTGREGDLTAASEMILDYVSELIKPYSSAPDWRSPLYADGKTPDQRAIDEAAEKLRSTFKLSE